MVYQWGSEFRTVTDHNSEEIFGQSCLVEQVNYVERGHAGERIRFKNNPVASEKCWYGVADGQSKWVVPRSNNPNNTQGNVAFNRTDQERESTRMLAVLESAEVARVVAGVKGYVKEFFICITPWFSGLPLDKVKEFVFIGEHQVVKAQHYPCAVAKGSLSPINLSSPCSEHRTRNVCLTGELQGVQLSPIWRSNRDPLTGCVGSKSAHTSEVVQLFERPRSVVHR